jgi:hypothetical protein
MFMPGLAVDAGAATITGKALFEGQTPVAQPVRMEADPVCLSLHTEPVTTEEVVANPNGTLKNVFVYVKEGLSGKSFPAPTTPVLFDQIGCKYEPHVLGVQVNQPFEILNSDGTLHNVHALAKTNKEFNIGMPIKGMKIKKQFTAPEVMVKMKCEVHPWMAAYVGVLDHPFFAVSGDDGSFQIKDLAPGNYVLEAWHEKYGTATQNVTIAAEGDTQDVSFQFKAA